MKKVVPQGATMSDNFTKSEKRSAFKRSKKVTFRIPLQLYDLSTERADQLGYRNIGRYFAGLALIDTLRGKWATRMKNVSNCDPEAQDYLFDQLLKLPIEANELIVFLKKIVQANIPETAKKIARKETTNETDSIKTNQV